MRHTNHISKHIARQRLGTAYIAFARQYRRPRAKWSTKSSCNSQTKPWLAVIICSSVGAGRIPEPAQGEASPLV